ncbi:magnesium transporter CorA family protein [Paraclostridium sordellii]|uniref:magnesium transporter CorA family protein n=1 Tax=Paraclostridium sordellii TaxID=1505 RepID=UPI0003857B01|nr:magnesium transporter CorA family protein [Paeniclostridium sordellii]EPZ62515.1 corA-like Mg2+ transporter family protein [[Clostridium] sordellii VPI 9048] [Paeniclostridium sordellii VPI 9048]MCH1966015.1 magnesium transporter CorA family protein [Paeniclostridium sordellii]CEK37904.1 putative cations transporter [[Clostridium] sordellii] [Paeniclostridium sordellii]CEP40737.1 cations transporter [[Clostridium] sordellii] [Paeniclostridium sordellii]CEP80331.1 cations transporter [[Clost
MIRYYKTIDSKLEKLKSFENGCWINLVEPTTAEILDISTKFNIDIESIRAALDEEERSRIDIEDNHILILIDIPIDESDASSAHYSTIPLGIILLDNTIVTICTAQTKILNDFIVGHVKNFFTFKKTRFILQILYKNASYYLHYLRRINKMTIAIEKEIYKSMKNKELVQLLELEKSLIYFSTSLKANELVLNKMLRTESIKKYSEDEDLLEDVIIENKQALEMATIYGDILSRIMDAFSAIVSNNQNTVMQFLTSITLIMSIPTIVSGFFGMNVQGLPFSTHVNGFWIVILITCIMCLILTFIMSRNKLL